MKAEDLQDGMRVIFNPPGDATRYLRYKGELGTVIRHTRYGDADVQFDRDFRIDRYFIDPTQYWGLNASWIAPARTPVTLRENWDD